MKYRAYIRWPGNNFGDNLNDIIFRDIMGIQISVAYNRSIFDQCLDDSMILGLGTILNSRFAPDSRFAVFGSGAKGKSFRLPNADILFVRGRISRELLGLTPDTAMGDAAYSISAYIQQRCAPAKKYRVGIIPHMQNIGHNIYRDCPDDCCIIDVTAPVNDVITLISQCQSIAAEAMHGAICADIMRVPWANIWINDNFRPEKWHDWISAFDQEITLHQIEGISDINQLRYALTDDKKFNDCCDRTAEILEVCMS